MADTDKPKTAAQKRAIVLKYLRAINEDQRLMVYRWTYSGKQQRYVNGVRADVPNPSPDPGANPVAWDNLASYAATKAKEFLDLQAFAKQQANELR